MHGSYRVQRCAALRCEPYGETAPADEPAESIDIRFGCPRRSPEAWNVNGSKSYGERLLLAVPSYFAAHRHRETSDAQVHPEHLAGAALRCRSRVQHNP